eukprot:1671365-Lingulodinium_polyedra.AAC.1
MPECQRRRVSHPAAAPAEATRMSRRLFLRRPRCVYLCAGTACRPSLARTAPSKSEKCAPSGPHGRS